jgi:hypothetical protein
MRRQALLEPAPVNGSRRTRNSHRMQPRGTSICASSLIAALAWTGVAHADEPLLPPLTAPSLLRDSASTGTVQDTWSTRKAAVSASAATGGPLGYGGLSFEYAPSRYLVLGGGAGFQPGGGTGAFTWRLRLPINRVVAIGFGAPLSTGPYVWTGSYVPPDGCSTPGCPFKVSRTWGWSAWVHVEPSIELRPAGGFALRIYGGRSFVLDPTDGVCASSAPGACPSRGGETQWYAGITAGVAF